MIPHHESAVEMATLAKRRAEHPEQYAGYHSAAGYYAVIDAAETGTADLTRESWRAASFYTLPGEPFHENDSNPRLRVASSRAGTVLTVKQFNPRWRT